MRGILLRALQAPVAVFLLCLVGCADPFLSISQVPDRTPSPLPAAEAQRNIQELTAENAAFQSIAQSLVEPKQ